MSLMVRNITVRNKGQVYQAPLVIGMFEPVLAPMACPAAITISIVQATSPPPPATESTSPAGRPAKNIGSYG